MTQKVFTFTNQKGGVGKTTLCVEFANYCAMNDLQVLVIDLDAQASATNLLKANANKHGVLHWLAGEPFDDIVQTNDDCIAVLSACRELETSTYKGNIANALKSKIETVPQFDVVVIDPPRVAGALQYMAISAATDIVLALTPCVMAANCTSLTIDTMKHLHKLDALKGVVVSQYKTRDRLSEQTVETIKAAFTGCKCFTIRDSKAVNNAHATGKSIFAYNYGRTNPAKDMRELFEMLLKDN